MLYEVCYCALSSIFAVEATHGRVARGGVLGTPARRRQLGPAAGRGPAPGSQPLIDQSIFSDWPPLYPLDVRFGLAGGPPASGFVISFMNRHATKHDIARYIPRISPAWGNG
jgi:hypothetical protein